MLKLANVLTVLGLVWGSVSYAKTSLFIQTNREKGNGYSIRKMTINSNLSSKRVVELAGVNVPGFYEADLTSYFDQVGEKDEVELRLEFELMKYFPYGGSTSHSFNKTITVKIDSNNFYIFKLSQKETGWTNYGQSKIPVVSETETLDVHADPKLFDGKSIISLELKPYSALSDPYWWD